MARILIPRRRCGLAARVTAPRADAPAAPPLGRVDVLRLVA